MSVRTSFRAVWFGLLGAVIALGVALVGLLWRSEASLADMGAAVAATFTALAASYFSLRGSRSRRERIRERQVFISYPHENTEAALVLAEAVSKDGYKPYLATPKEGESLADTVERQLKKSGVVLMMSPAQVAEGRTRNWIHFEREVLREARGLQRDEPAVVPVIYSVRGSVGNSSSEALDLGRPGWQLVLRDHLARIFGERSRAEGAFANVTETSTPTE